ncbi:sigma-70 family RNA polymerase sigma factor [Thalassobaculum litoreum]|uniref:RNA polymerase sigma-70 factor, ECF subfamily n=1 Tax=Thalassobaculum litoreum DSM 18839 TaxID=1123362 RepID=A0A8G2BHE4_9PROT|nr:sigma-70 family RNA polymerase sigma factor [Thalassobaculum litoreum]SDF73712.1 RNA polymerase sigma-70 factor, ECF subfamily [Thalassobaculum litoreum DSM 18839]
MLASSSDISRLLDRVAGGDRQAFADLYEATAPKLYGIILRILRRRDETDEVVQDVYVKIWQRAGDFDPARASPITWMATIARNRALDEVRRARVATVSDDIALERAADPARSALGDLEAGEDRRRLEICLDALEGERGSLVRLAYLDGLSRQDLADRFGQPVGTIKTWLHRSLKQLRDCLTA